MFWQSGGLAQVYTELEKKSRMVFSMLYAPFGALKAYAMMFILYVI